MDSGTVSKLAHVGTEALRLASIFFPQLSPLVTVAAGIEKGAPIVVDLIRDGIPAYEAVKQATPDFFPNVKKLVAFAVHGDLSAANKVSDAKAMEAVGPILFGRPWTQEETQRWWDQAQGVH